MMFARELKLRLRELRAFDAVIRQIGTQIRCSAADVRSVMEKVLCTAAARDTDVLRLCSGAADGRQIARVIEENRHLTALTAEDTEIVTSFFISLGRSDVEGETENCRLHQSRLLLQIEEAEAQMRGKSRLCCMMGLFCGLVISILLV